MRALALVALLILAAAAHAIAADMQRCRMCGMNTAQSQTEFVVHLEGGGQERTCCLHCVYLLQRLAGGPKMLRLETRDFSNGSLTDAREALYLEGSTLIPKGSMAPFLLAFGTREAAERYRQRVHGNVVDFAQAMRIVARFDEEGSAAPPATASPEKQADICRVCGMYIQRFKRTAVHVRFKSGEVESCCGVACGIRVINSRGGYAAVESAEITAWDSHDRKAMRQATYVIGSKVIPDMLPNIIGFDSEEAARRFVAEKGGKITSLDDLFQNTSYRGLTAPFRIPPAAVPSEGVLNVNGTYSSRHMDGLMRGTGSLSQRQGLVVRPMVPVSMKTAATSLQVGYGATDDVFIALTVPEFWKYQKAAMRSGMMRTSYTNGVGDVAVVTRWRFWHDTDFDDHLGVYAAVTLPTGNYVPALRDSAMMQLGTGTVTVTPGILYSKHFDQFWFHAAALYTFTPTNGDHYKFGDGVRGGVALHWVPNYKDLVGVELDYESSEANCYNGIKIPSTGRAAAYYTIVYQRQLILVGGGNMNVNLLYGGPLYQRVNDIQLGESSHWGAGLQWQRRF